METFVGILMVCAGWLLGMIVLELSKVIKNNLIKFVKYLKSLDEV